MSLKFTAKCSGVLKETSGIGILEEVLFELNNIHFNLENVLKNKQGLDEERDRFYHGVQTEYENDQRKKTHQAFGKCNKHIKFFVAYGWRESLHVCFCKRL